METPIKAERERRGISQNEIADAVGIDRTHYGRIERDEVGASREVAKKIAEYFGRPITPMHVLYPADYIQQPHMEKVS